MTAGLYVHIPFCSALCPYCDFAVVVAQPENHARYCEALVQEAAARASHPVSTVFVGGGTPTFVDASLLCDVLARLSAHFPAEPGAEITVEANPDSVTVAPLRTLRAAGVNRLSIGAQSFDDRVLRALGRTHSADDVAAAVDAARAAGLDNVSVDLIYGGPGETTPSWTASVERAIGLGVEHVSCYALTIEERTAFGTAVARGAMPPPDEDALADRFEVAVDLLGAAGYEHYEISNWAKPGRRCAHNMTYWTQADYVGLGVGAHSHHDGHRWWNARALQRYLADPANAVAGEERLDDRQRGEEWLSLRIRLCDGFAVEDARRVVGTFPETADLEEAGFVVREDGRFRLSTKGMLIENEITARLLNAPRP